ncbi:L-aspartate oxidase [Salinimicrobium oceani]|uniref:L-aspartate oxidase n=1 Tax=Salinimicrobium oceani TaxID=2722702 RepID=A0ABX1CX57_9FLAO|nr:L-aspartate oxidase [Salinimicrobium oceani]NJW51534.1 L-aspartate oxidase [Salinimicrobium oceani]
MKTDVLIIGSGVAGLSFAIKVAEARPEVAVTIITKEAKEVSNTAHAQGGIAVVLDRIADSFDLHVKDTLTAGGGLNDREVVKMVISQAPDRLLELVEWGTSFDSGKNGKYDLALEGGHSRPRIVHHRDLTGKEIQQKLIMRAKACQNIQFYDHFFVTDLMLSETGKHCIGITALNKRTAQETSISSKVTFLASGGCGMVFKNTTNPAVATGDGVAMAWRAGASIKQMNFIQFHPTAVYEEGKNPLFLISEAVRGFGAYVVNQKGNRFLYKSDMRGELATRDVVSEAIVKELKSSGEKCAYLDCRHLDLEKFGQEFPTIISYCSEIGINLATDRIPIVPAAHYQCGGIEVDNFARTSIKNLYASGECAFTGLHGSNRLASNSLLEALVFSHQASKMVARQLDLIPAPVAPRQKILLNHEDEADDDIIASLSIRLNEIMDYDLLYTASKREKKEALEQIQYLQDVVENYPPFNSGTVSFYEFRNRVQTAMLILKDSIAYSLPKKGFSEEIF